MLIRFARKIYRKIKKLLKPKKRFDLRFDRVNLDGNELYLDGWIFDKDQIKSIKFVEADGSIETPIPIHPRPDVVAGIPEVTHDQIGFSLRKRVKELENGHFENYHLEFKNNLGRVYTVALNEIVESSKRFHVSFDLIAKCDSEVVIIGWAVHAGGISEIQYLDSTDQVLSTHKPYERRHIGERFSGYKDSVLSGIFQYLEIANHQENLKIKILAKSGDAYEHVIQLADLKTIEPGKEKVKVNYELIDFGRTPGHFHIVLNGNFKKGFTKNIKEKAKPYEIVKINDWHNAIHKPFEIKDLASKIYITGSEQELNNQNKLSIPLPECKKNFEIPTRCFDYSLFDEEQLYELSNTRFFSLDHLWVDQFGIGLFGWALFIEPVKKIQVSLNGSKLGNASIGFDRPDIFGIYQYQYPHARDSGFKFYHSANLEEHLISGINRVKFRIEFENLEAQVYHKYAFDRTKTLLPLHDINAKVSKIKKIQNSTIQLLDPVTLIVPVYNGVEFLDPLFESILKHTEGDYKLIVIDDQSPDNNVFPKLQEWSTKFRAFTLLKNEQNLGFVKTVNRAVEMVENNFVLLNTDIELPKGWLDRLMQPIQNNAQIASVTPFSNAATIFGFPNQPEDNPIYLDLDPEIIDNAFQDLRPGATIEVPTGVGFCMAVNYKVVKRIGFFDQEAFGKGYGEENDWCLRAELEGFSSVGIDNLFVFHKHGGSFQSDEKQKLVAQNLQLIEKRYPYYLKDVANFIEDDPFSKIKKEVATKLYLDHSNLQEAVLIIDHEFGGGSNAYREKLAAELLEAEKPLIKYLSNPNTQRQSITLCSKENQIELRVTDFQQVLDFCRHYKIQRWVINSLLGFPNLLGLLKALTVYIPTQNITADYLLHDYHAVCQRYTLLDYKKKYCGVPKDLSVCNNCLSHSSNKNLQVLEQSEWREVWSDFLQETRKILAFSKTSVEVFKKAYPNLVDKTVVKPHEVIPFDSKNAFEQKNPDQSTVQPHLAIIGGINFQKGSEQVIELARYLKANHIEDFAIVVIGSLSSEIDNKSLYPYLKITGEYERANLLTLLDLYKSEVVWIPSIWPETFCYTAEEAVQLNRKLMIYDLGAPMERHGGKYYCKVLEVESSPDEVVEAYKNLTKL
jgi:GT2 family glycosyltransferase